MTHRGLPIPPHFDPEKVGRVWRVDYQAIAAAARQWARKHGIRPASADRYALCLVLVDVQNTFCIPGFELFVGGRSGTGAVDDNIRLCRFIYQNMDRITLIAPTMDTHHAMQIFHPVFFVDADGRHPDPFTRITAADIQNGKWTFNRDLAFALGIDKAYGKRHLAHYVQALEAGGRYDLTVWPYHAMLGGIGHALVSAVEEAVFFHGMARFSRPDFQIKGDRTFTENYSVLRPEVTQGPDGAPIGGKNVAFIERLMTFDAVVIAGQAKSHCLAWTIDDLLTEIQQGDRRLAKKVYLLEDCTSPVVIPGVIDYTDQADAAFKRFSDAGMHVVRSTDTLSAWPGIRLE
ncbi:MAG: isochorismatase [Deltaproteobacteria bacterium]|nr:isochorismatase [Deltaproteobacteria bacterium]MBW2041390.1 isochorismatase [Deltaproteobacteria bacterium]MBW2131544.1 isochorismatase [Deltaproteobacteria bacterium]